MDWTWATLHKAHGLTLPLLGPWCQYWIKDSLVKPWAIEWDTRKREGSKACFAIAFHNNYV